jgi:phosphopantetheinyl transferase (holo-ACP synthase)
MVHRFVLRSSENYFTQEFPRELLGGLPAPISLSAATGFPPALFTANQGLWLRCLAFVLLSPPEREEWLGMRALPARRVEWLLGRAAAKEAARRLLLHHYHLHYNAPDIPIWASDTGKPAPYGPWQAAVPATMDLSIAHTPGLILAAAVAGARVGIDVENAGRDLSEAFTLNAFARGEHELAASSGDGPCTILRFWCAKEAFAKALGTGIRYAAGDLRIREYDAGTGDVTIEAVGQWAESIEGLHNARFPVRAVLWQTYVIAVCVL